MRTTKSNHNGSALTKLANIHIQRHALRENSRYLAANMVQILAECWEMRT